MYHIAIINETNYPAINTVQFGYEDCEKSHFYGPAIRTYWLIHFVVSGFGIFKINNKDYKIGPGEMFVIPPYIETYYEADNKNPWSYIWIGFTADSALPLKLSDTIYHPEAFEIFNQMKNYESYQDNRNAFLNARIWDLFVLLMEKSNRPKSYVENALAYMHSEYMHELSIENIAQSLNLDRTYFSCLFKNETGFSPKQYLTKYRMNMAASLLLKNPTKISVIANSVGYNDLYTFSKVFKKHYGISPALYRSIYSKR